MARYAEILERRRDADGDHLLCRVYMDGSPDVDGNPTTIELGKVEVEDGPPASVRDALVKEAQRLQQLPVGKIINL